MIKKSFPTVITLIWYLMLLILPITSMPLVARILKSDTVATPSILFLILLLIFWLVPYLWRSGRISKLSVPLMAFVFSAILSTLLAFFIEIPTFKNFSFFRNEFQSVGTLIIGFSFFIISATFPKDEKIFKKSLKMINWSGLVMLIWAGIQIFSWFGFHKYFPWMFNFQGLISSRVLYHNRTTGFALEPSWFAHQLNMLYLPWWLAASIKKYSSHKLRLLGLSFENMLLICGVVALFFTLSRGGLLAFLLVLTLIFIYFNVHLIRKIKTAWLNNLAKNKRISQTISHCVTILLVVIMLVFYILLIGMGAFILSRFDPRMKSLFEFGTDKENSLLSYFNNLQFGERAVYWLSGWEIFGDYPIMGVGLGNAGFFFPAKITPYGWTLIEIRRLMYEYNVILNIKNLWIRILAETGIVGFALFIAWLIVLILAFLHMSSSKKLICAAAGLAGIFVITALPAEGFSIDSFALPYLWISLGLAVAGFQLSESRT